MRSWRPNRLFRAYAGRTRHPGLRPYFRPRLVRLEGRLAPATFVVVNTNDSGPDSFRQAVLSANALAGTDDIVFDATTFATPQTITLTTGVVNVTGSVNIVGPGAKLATISGALQTQILAVAGPGALTLAIADLTFADGSNNLGHGGAIGLTKAASTITGCTFSNNSAAYPFNGGAIYGFDANLTLANCTLSGNTAIKGGALALFHSYYGVTTKTSTVTGSVFANNVAAADGGAIATSFGPTTLITNSVFTGNVAGTYGSFGRGGAVHSEVTNLTVSGCTLSGNTASQGGALNIFQYFDFTIASSTLSGNTGGALVVVCYGGTSATKVINSTIANNVGPGIFLVPAFDQTVVIANSTITGNKGGGIARTEYASGLLTLELNSTILSGNSAAVGPDAFTVAGDTVTANFSAIGSTSGIATLINNNTSVGADLRLGSLKARGGPTMTISLLPGSAAIDQGQNSLALPNDQRGSGSPRVIDYPGVANGTDGTDVGAYEVSPNDPPAAAGSFADVTAAGATSYSLTANYYAYGVNTINTATLDNADIRVTGPNGFNVLATFDSFTAIPGGVAAKYTITPPGGNWDFFDYGSYTVAVEPNQVTDSNAAVVAAESLGQFTVAIPGLLVVTNANDAGPGSFRQAVLFANAAGAADTISFDPAFFGTPQTIALTSGAVEITDSTRLDNSALGASLVTLKGVVIVTGKVNSVVGLTFTDGGLGLSSATASAGSTTIDKCVFTNNRAIALGIAGSVTVSDCVFTANTPDTSGQFPTSGGAVLTFGGDVSFVRCTFTGNVANQSGGAIQSNNSKLDIQDCTFTGNVATGGGAIQAYNGSLTLTNCTLSGNVAVSPFSGGGGAISTVSFSGGMAFKAVNCTIANNTTTGIGGGLSIGADTLDNFLISNCTITGNVAQSGGGIGRRIYSFPYTTQTLTVESSIVAGNSAAIGPDVNTFGKVSATASAFGSTAGIPTFINIQSSVGAALRLSTLAFHGGPTMTVALLPGSAAIDQGANNLALATDQRGAGNPRTFDYPGVVNGGDGTDVGAYEVDPAAVPIADAVFADVTVGGATTHLLTVTYYAYGASTINTATLDDADVRITGPGGFNVPAKFVSSAAVPNGIAATYSFTPPGGSWDLPDNGFFAVSVEGNQVLDSAGKAVPAGPVNRIKVGLPQVFVVTNAADAGAGSLRQAILDANAALGSDTITFDPAFFNAPKVISLTTGVLAVTDTVVIDNSTLGPGVVTVNTNRKSAAFDILDPFRVISAKLSGLTITNSFGGVISNGEDVTLTDCVIAGNPGSVNSRGTAVFVRGGKLTVERCELTDNSGSFAGGAVYAETAVVVLRNSTVSRNRSTSEGGAVSIVAQGQLTVENCTLADNTASGDGGAIFASLTSVSLLNSTLSGNAATGSNSDGGAISLPRRGYFIPQNYAAISFNAVNCTIANNTAAGTSAFGGGVHFDNAFTQTFVFSNCTITGNKATGASARGGGIGRVSGGSQTIQINSSIVSGNSAATGKDVSAGTVVGNYSAFGSTAGITSFTNNQSSVGAALNLSPLAFHGGDRMTVALLPGSAGIDQGKNLLGLATDQRGTGFARVIDDPSMANKADGADVGAYEVDPATPLAEGAFANVIGGGGTAYALTVSYYAYGTTAIDTATLNDADIRVTGPGGFSALAKFKSFSAITGGVQANYEVTPPGGAWDLADNGVYSVSLEPNQVFNAPAGAAALGGLLGNFVVVVPRTFVVTNVNDAGLGSLRQAIADANDTPNSTVNSVTTNDVIVFDPGVYSSPQTIVLSTGELTIADSVTIEGPGAKLAAVDAGAKSRHINIGSFNSPVLTVNISGLTLTNGAATDFGGGSIFADNDVVTLSGMVLTKNSAIGDGGAVLLNQRGSLTVIDSTIAGNTAIAQPGTFYSGAGGGITVENGALTLIRTTVSGNTSSWNAGGIFMNYNDFSGTFKNSLTIVDSTIAGNTSNTKTFSSFNTGGGGIYFDGPVGPGGFTITNTTISGNKSFGDSGAITLRNVSGSLLIQNCTITGNDAKTSGGGFARVTGFGTVTLQSTIVAGNTINGANHARADLFFGVSTNVAGNNNLIGIQETSNNAKLTGAGNKTGTLASPLNAKLGPLANNGGPTLTHVLLPGSPAINAGNNAANLAFDQRGSGFARTVGAGADIGAFEVEPPPPPPTVAAVMVNGSAAAQRSRVTSVTVTFSGQVIFSGNPAGAFALVNQKTTAPVTLAAAVGYTGPGTVVTLTFTGGSIDGPGAPFNPPFSLADGRYTLTIDAAKVSGPGGQLDGDGNGSGGDNYVLASSGTAGVFRLFGDNDGDGRTDDADFTAFRSAFGGTTNLAFDTDGDGDVDARDFAAFRARFGASV